MNNKTKTYALLAGVLIIWGIIGFKIVSALDPDLPRPSHQDDTVLFTPQTTQDIDTFSIQPLQRDPFLGTVYIKSKPTSTKPKINKSKGPVVWVSVNYHGIVSKQGSPERICVLSINGQQHLMKIGQKIDGVTLIRATSSDVLVGYKGMKKTITKS